MKTIVSVILLLCSFVVGYGQVILPLRADTVRIYKVGPGASAELLLQNSTRDSLGVLVNVSNGKTRFMKSKVLNDSTIVVGLDTLRIRGTGGTGGAGLDTTAADARYVMLDDHTFLFKDTLSLVGIGADTFPLAVRKPNIVYTVPTAFRTMGLSLFEATNSVFETIEPRPQFYGHVVSRWYFDPFDNSTPDDGYMVIVDGNGFRYKRAYENSINPEWFGAFPDDQIADDVGLNACSDWVIARPYIARTKKIELPNGTWYLDNPWIIHAFGLFATNDYQAVSVHVTGRTPEKSGMLNCIIKAFPGNTDLEYQFYLGVQKPSDVVIENMIFEGNNILTLQWSATEVFNHQYLDWAPNEVYRRKAPPALVAVDPFSNDSTGGYPGLASWYKQVQSGGGTNLLVKNCRLMRSPVAFANSCNAWSSNADMIRMKDVAIFNCRDGWVSGQGQARQCVMEDVEVFMCHTIINTVRYGGFQGVPPSMVRVLMASGVKEMIFNGSSDAPFKAIDCYAESLYRIGLVNGVEALYTNQSSFVNCELNIYAPDANFKSQDWIIQGRAEFKNSKVIYTYPTGITDSSRLKFNGRGMQVKFDGGTVGMPLLSMPSPTAAGNYALRDGKASFENVLMVYPGGNYPVPDVPYNKHTIEEMVPDKLARMPLPSNHAIQWEEVPGVKYKMEWSEAMLDKNVYLGTRTVTVDTLGQASFTATTDDLKLIHQGDYIVTDSAYGAYYSDMIPGYNDDAANNYKRRDYSPAVGIITSISGTTVNLRGASANLRNGANSALRVYVNYVKTIEAPFVGTLTSGTDSITAIEFFTPKVQGSYNVPFVGARIEHPFIPEGAFIKEMNFAGRYIVLSKATTGSGTKITFNNGNPQITAYSNLTPTVAKSLGVVPAFFGGSTWIQDYISSGVPKRDIYIINSGILESPGSRTLDAVPLSPAPIDLSGYVDKTTTETIGGIKTFYNNDAINTAKFYADGSNSAALAVIAAGTGNAGLNLYRGNVFRYGFNVTTNNDFSILNGNLSRQSIFIKNATNNVLMDPPFDNDNGAKLQVTGTATFTDRVKNTVHISYIASDSLRFTTKKYVDSLWSTISGGTTLAKNTDELGASLYSHKSGDTLIFRQVQGDQAVSVSEQDSVVFITVLQQYFVLNAWHGTFSVVADGETYYWGASQTSLAPSTGVNTRYGTIPMNCTMTHYTITTASNTTAPTQETSTIWVRKNNSSDITLSTAVTISATLNQSRTFQGTTTQTNFDAGDTWEIKWTTPAWATNPGTAQILVSLYFKTR